MVRLEPRGVMRRSLINAYRKSGLSREELAELLNVTPTVLGSYLTAKAIPDPPTFLELRRLLKIAPDAGIDFWYIMLLAEQEPRRRTSNIKGQHVIDAALPDPLTATSAVALRQKLREVHDWAMQPSYRELEEKTGGALKKSTIGDMLHPGRDSLPRFDRYAHFLEACGVRDLTCWIAAWRRFAPPARLQIRMIEQAAYEKLTEKLTPGASEPYLRAS
ncbi:helix-turn-helix domain-containing protein [Streptomyces sp. B21-079]|uniref:helix-turn-helix domain-containing protein n=1 Tax=Streptomyces sp. B21-079 TaxID=3039409 RepID=UPI002FEFFD7B